MNTPHVASSHSARPAFLTGAFINLLNPKTDTFFLVVAPQFMEGALSVRTALIFSLISAAVATVIHLAIVIAGSKAHSYLTNSERTAIVRRLFAVLMLGVAISFVAAGFD